MVFGPATDGGYYLVGLAHPQPHLFHRIAWGSERVLRQSLDILARNGDKPALLQRLDDLDRPEDLQAWHRTVEIEEGDVSRISVIIPALNEAAGIAAILKPVSIGNLHHRESR